MEVTLTADQAAFVRQAVQAGRLQREEDAVQEALLLWEERERVRAEILSSLAVSDASLERGEGRTVNAESMKQLATDVKERGRARLACQTAATG